MMTKILICGSRDFGFTFKEPNILSDKAQRQIEYFHKTLDSLVKENNWKVSSVISGGATGADYLAERWAKWNGIKTEIYIPNWQKYKKSAGVIRNKQMLEEGKPDVVIAFYNDPSNLSNGTSNMVEISKKAGVTTYEFGL